MIWFNFKLLIDYFFKIIWASILNQVIFFLPVQVMSLIVLSGFTTNSVTLITEVEKLK